MNLFRRVFGTSKPEARESGPLPVPCSNSAGGGEPGEDTDRAPPGRLAASRQEEAMEIASGMHAGERPGPAEAQDGPEMVPKPTNPGSEAQEDADSLRQPGSDAQAVDGDPDRPLVTGRLPNAEDSEADAAGIATADAPPDPATHESYGPVKAQLPWPAEHRADAAGSGAAPAADAHDRFANMEVSHASAPPPQQVDPTAGAPLADPSGADRGAGTGDVEDSRTAADGRTGPEPPQEAADVEQHDAGLSTFGDIQDGASNTMIVGEDEAGRPDDLAQQHDAEASASPGSGGREQLAPTATQADTAGSGHLELKDALATAIGSGAQDEPSTLADLGAHAPGEPPPPPDFLADVEPLDDGELDLDDPEI